jgi:hypothetical protein
MGFQRSAYHPRCNNDEWTHVPVHHQILQQLDVPVDGVDAVDETCDHNIAGIRSEAERQRNYHNREDKKAVHCVHDFRKENFEFSRKSRRVTLEQLKVHVKSAKSTEIVGSGRDLPL